MSIRILGTGSYVPSNIVTNDDLSKLVETSDEWISQRVGIKERRISTNETAADFAIQAAKNALESSGSTADEIDLIICATISSDTVAPTVASWVQSVIGAKCPAFDINSACSGFLFALDNAVSYLMRGKIRKAIVIGAERLSKIIDWTDRNTCVIFGDGAGAVVIEPGDGYISSVLSTQGSDETISIPSYLGSSPFYKGEGKKPFVYMNGQETFKFAVSKIEEDIKYVVKAAGMEIDDIDHIVTHQANLRIIDYASRRLGIPKDKFVINIDKYGNTSSASIPIALDELNKSGNLKRGDTVVMSAFGGGLSNAACLIKW